MTRLLGNLAYFSIAAMPLALTLMSMGSVYRVLGLIVILIYFLTLSFPAILQADSYRLNLRYSCTILLFSLVVLAYARAAIAGHFDVSKSIALAVMWAIILTGLPTVERMRIPGRVWWYGLQIFVLVNLIGFMLNIEPPENAYADSGDAKMLALLGLQFQRVLFPFSLGVNGFGVIAGLSTVIGCVFAYKSLGVLNTFLLFSSVVALALSDSRGAIVCTIITVLMLAIVQLIGHRPRMLTGISFGVSFFYPLLTLNIYMASLSLPSMDDSIMRGKGSLISGREMIWECVFDAIKNSDITHLICGWGHFGHVPSKASQGYMQMFAHLSSLAPEFVNVHSSALQVLLDMGVIGLIIMMIACFTSMQFALTFVASDRHAAEIAIFAFLLYSVLAGAVDLTLNQNNLVFFYLLLVVASWNRAWDD